MRALSLPVPSLVICELLGVPYADHDFFESRAGIMLRHGTPAGESAAAFGELRAYVDTLVSRNEQQRRDGLLGRLVDKYRQAGIHDHDLLVELSMVLLVAGHETTANMISLGTVALLEHPDQRAKVMADPALIGPAVEELLRHFSVADAVTARVTRIPGLRLAVPAGELPFKHDSFLYGIHGVPVTW